MGKKKMNGEYNDFLDGEKLHDNNEIRTSLQDGSTNNIPPAPTHQNNQKRKSHGKRSSGPKKPQLTHFLCLPLITSTSLPQFQAGLSKLQDDLSQDSIIPPKAVRPLGTLHLTLGVMSLSDDQLSDAKSFLSSLSLHRILRDLTQRIVAQHAAEEGSISENLNAAALPDTDFLAIDLCALEPMQAPNKTSIMYASPRDSTQRLYPFARALREEFMSEGLMVEDKRELKLHATVVNTIYAKSAHRGRKSHVKETLKHVEQKVSPHHHQRESGSENEEEKQAKSEGHGPDAKSWLQFDARGLIERYKDFTWAEDVRIDRVQICKMGAKKILGENGEIVDERYEVVAEKGIFE